jgi:hypothetical protein
MAKLDLTKLSEPVDVKNIDFRIQSVNSNGWATILAYKDARYDMNMLDKVVGPENWQRRHSVIEGRLYCEVGIRHPETGEWVWKMDVGTESNTEAEKGQASDSFKRACFNWGIGRELYDFPYIGIQLADNEFYTKQLGQKTIGAAKVYLNTWTFDVKRDKEGNLIGLSIRDKSGKIRYSYGEGAEVANKTPAKKAAPAKKAPVKKAEPKAETSKEKVDPSKARRTSEEAIEALEKCTNIDELKMAWDLCRTWGFGSHPTVSAKKDELKTKLISEA